MVFVVIQTGIDLDLVQTPLARLETSEKDAVPFSFCENCGWAGAKYFRPI